MRLKTSYFLLVLTISLSTFIIWNNTLYGQSMVLDSSFGHFGQVAIPITTTKCTGLEIQSDKKMVVTDRENAFRLNHSGTPDDSYGVNGKADLSALFFNSITSIAMQEDDKLVLAANTFIVDQSNDILLLRLTSEGELDPTFGNEGTIQYDFGGNSEEINDISILSDGKILIAGKANGFDDVDFFAMRLLTDGSPDNTFGVNGQVKINFNDQTLDNDVCRSILVLPDNSILLSGSAIFGGQFWGAFAKLHEDGTLDVSFADHGLRRVFGKNNQTNEADVMATKLLNNESILAGITPVPGASQSPVEVIKMNFDGVSDQDFGAVLTRPLNAFMGLSSIEVLEDDRFLLIGPFSTLSGFGPSIFTYAYNNDGSVDSSFGDNGILFTSFDHKLFATPRYSLIQPNGKLVIAGESFKGRLCLVRYNIDYEMKKDNSLQRDVVGLSVVPNIISDHSVNVQFEIRQSSPVKILLSTMNGVSEILYNSESLEPGVYDINFKAATDFKGLCFLRLTSGGGSYVEKLVFVE